MEALARLLLPIALVVLFLALAFRRPVKQAFIEADGPADEPYRIFTREFDLVLPAADVLGKLASASPDAAKNWLHGSTAESVVQMESALSDGRALIGARRDADLAMLRAAMAGVDPAEMVVGILVDQSGSMKGARMAAVSAASTLLIELLEDVGIRSEVLGFTTAGWQGGHARAKWQREGKPRRPGRLAALMHIVYKSADDPPLDDAARRVMVHPDLPRENIDGEAILWAWERLMARPERAKILMVLSDGAPVDDSTLTQNGPSYLYRHLQAVLHKLGKEPSLLIGGVGIEHRVESLYPMAETAESLDDLYPACYRLLERLLAATKEVSKLG
jgi:cobaltochelatase CobT